MVLNSCPQDSPTGQLAAEYCNLRAANGITCDVIQLSYKPSLLSLAHYRIARQQNRGILSEGRCPKLVLHTHGTQLLANNHDRSDVLHGFSAL